MAISDGAVLPEVELTALHNSAYDGSAAYSSGSYQRIMLIAGLAGWFAAWVVLYSITSYHFFPMVTDPQFGPLSADPMEMFDMLAKPSLYGDAPKHPMFFLGPGHLVFTLEKKLGIEPVTAVRVFLPCMAALNILMMLVILQRFFVRIVIAVLIGTFYGLCFSNLVIFSIPESYVLSVLLILIYMYLFLEFKHHLSSYNAIVLGVVAGVAGLCNPPLLSLAMIPAIHALITRGIGNALVFGAIMLVTSLLVFLGVSTALYGVTTYVEFIFEYTSRYASFLNFLDPTNVLNVALNLLFYSVMAPGWQIQDTYYISDIAKYFTSIMGIIGFVGFSALLYNVVRTLIEFGGPTEICVGTGLLFVLGFYIYFNPHEAILYSPQVLPFICMLLAAALNKKRWCRACTIFVVTLMVMGFHNLFVVFSSSL